VAGDGYTIGEVLTNLKEDFSDVTISKIRFLESEGLISPARTSSGYRTFNEDDVDRLRFILTAQRDHFLPLKVIRERLERLDAEDSAVDAATSPAVSDRRDNGSADGPGREPSTPSLDDTGGDLYSTKELAEAAGVSVERVRELTDYGLLEGGPGESGYRAGDVQAAKAAGELLDLGLEPRHLRMYRHFVDREVSLFKQLVNPQFHQRRAEGARSGREQLERLAAVSDRLHRLILTRELRSYLHGG